MLLVLWQWGKRIPSNKIFRSKAICYLTIDLLEKLIVTLDPGAWLPLASWGTSSGRGETQLKSKSVTFWRKWIVILEYESWNCWHTFVRFRFLRARAQASRKRAFWSGWIWWASKGTQLWFHKTWSHSHCQYLPNTQSKTHSVAVHLPVNMCNICVFELELKKSQTKKDLNLNEIRMKVSHLWASFPLASASSRKVSALNWILRM